MMAPSAICQATTHVDGVPSGRIEGLRRREAQPHGVSGPRPRTRYDRSGAVSDLEGYGVSGSRRDGGIEPHLDLSLDIYARSSGCRVGREERG